MTEQKPSARSAAGMPDTLDRRRPNVSLFDHPHPGRQGALLPPLDVPPADPAALYGAAHRPEVRGEVEASEVDVVRHFTRLSRLNFAIDTALYSLGSCTMKHNPLHAELNKAWTFDTYEDYLRYRQVLDELSALVSVTVPEPVVSEAAWLANKPVPMTWSPIEVIAQVRIPVLAIWGERDTKIDPIRGAHAYRDALEQAGNPNYRVEVIPGVDHTLAPSETGCISEEGQTLERVLEEQGFTFEDLNALDPQDPVLFTLLSAWPQAPEYLDLIEEWLRGL